MIHGALNGTENGGDTTPKALEHLVARPCDLFELDAAPLAGLHAEDITAATTPRDLQRSPWIHRWWKITRSE